MEKLVTWCLTFDSKSRFNKKLKTVKLSVVEPYG